MALQPQVDPLQSDPLTQQALPTPPTQVDLVNQSKDEADEAIAVAQQAEADALSAGDEQAARRAQARRNAAERARGEVGQRSQMMSDPVFDPRSKQNRTRREGEVWTNQARGFNNSIVVAGDGSALLVDNDGDFIANLGQMDIDTTVAMDQRMTQDQLLNEKFDIETMELRRSLEDMDARDEMYAHMNGVVLNRMFDGLSEMPTSQANLLAEAYAELGRFVDLNPAEFQAYSNLIHAAVAGGSMEDVMSVLSGAGERSASGATERNAARSEMMGEGISTFNTRIKDSDARIADLTQQLVAMEAEEASAIELVTQETMGMEETTRTEKIRAVTDKWKEMKKSLYADLTRERTNRQSMVRRRDDLTDRRAHDAAVAGARPFAGSTKNMDEMLASRERHNVLDGPMSNIMDIVARNNGFTGRNDPDLGDQLHDPDQLISFIAECQMYAENIAGWSDGAGSEDAWAAAILAKAGPGDFEDIQAAIEGLTNAKVSQVMNAATQQPPPPTTGGGAGTGSVPGLVATTAMGTTTPPPDPGQYVVPPNTTASLPDGLTRTSLTGVLRSIPGKAGVDVASALERGIRPATDTPEYNADKIAMVTAAEIALKDIDVPDEEKDALRDMIVQEYMDMPTRDARSTTEEYAREASRRSGIVVGQDFVEAVINEVGRPSYMAAMNVRGDFSEKASDASWERMEAAMERVAKSGDFDATTVDYVLDTLRRRREGSKRRPAEGAVDWEDWM